MLLLTVLSLVQSAQAADTSQYFWQPAAQGVAVTPSFRYTRYRSVTESLRSNGRESNTDYRQAGLKAQYGLTDQLSLAMAMGYAFGNTMSTSANRYETIGLTNPSVALNGKLPLNNRWTLQYGVGGSVSPGASNYDSASRKENAVSGGHSMGLSTGIEVLLPAGFSAGAEATYTHRLRRTLNSDGREWATITGSHPADVTVFGESKFKGWTLALDTGLTRYASAQVHQAGSFRSTNSTNGAYFDLHSSAASTIALAEQTDFILQMTYATLLTKEYKTDERVATATGLGGSANLRFAF